MNVIFANKPYGNVKFTVIQRHINEFLNVTYANHSECDDCIDTPAITDNYSQYLCGPLFYRYLLRIFAAITNGKLMHNYKLITLTITFLQARKLNTIRPSRCFQRMTRVI